MFRRCLVLSAAMLAAGLLGACATTTSMIFKIKKIFGPHWNPTEVIPSVSDEIACSQHCFTRGGDCTAFSVDNDDNSCELGHLSGDPIFDEAAGKEVIVTPGNLTITPHYLINIYGGEEGLVDLNTRTWETSAAVASFEASGLLTPRAWGNWYKGGMLMCTEGATNECKYLTLTTGVWTPVQNLPRTHEAWHTTVAILDQVWIIGGNEGYVHVFKDWKWQEGPDYPHRGRGFTAVKLTNSVILSCGGWEHRVDTMWKECYKMDAAAADKAWIPAQPLPSNASYFGMTAFRSADGKPKAMIATGKVFGFGVPPQDFVLIYDAETDAWTTMNRFTAGGHVGSALITVDNVIYHLGGDTAAGPPNTEIRRYDPVADAWTDTGATFTGRYMHAMAYNNH